MTTPDEEWNPIWHGRHGRATPLKDMDVPRLQACRNIIVNRRRKFWQKTHRNDALLKDVEMMLDIKKCPIFKP